MSQENGEIDPLIHALGQRWWPVEDMAFWREFKKRWPPPAEALLDRAHFALFGTERKTK